MSEIPEDIMLAASKCYWDPEYDSNPEVAAKAILDERNRCLSIVKAIDPHNEAEAHLIETIVRRMRGEE